MGRTLSIKLAVVGVVVIVSLILSMPPGEKISLGLDLRGGLHLVLEVQVEKAVEQSLERTAETVRKDLLAAGVPIVAVEPYNLQGIRLLFREPPERAAVNDAVLNALPFSQVVEQSPEVWTYEIPADELNQIRGDAVNQALEKIRNRVDAFGVSEPSISRQGARHPAPRSRRRPACHRPDRQDRPVGIQAGAVAGHQRQRARPARHRNSL